MSDVTLPPMPEGWGEGTTKYRVYQHVDTGLRMAFRWKLLRPYKRRMVRLRKRLMANWEKLRFFWGLSFAEIPAGGYGKIIREFFNKLRAWCKRRGKTLSYVWRYEEGDDKIYIDHWGNERQATHRPHFHCLWNVFVPIRVVRRLWGRGFIRVKAVYGNKWRLMAYIGKYFTKMKRSGDEIEIDGEDQSYDEDVGCEYRYWDGGREWSSSRDLTDAGERKWNLVGTCCERDLPRAVNLWNEKIASGEWSKDDREPNWVIDTIQYGSYWIRYEQVWAG